MSGGEHTPETPGPVPPVPEQEEERNTGAAQRRASQIQPPVDQSSLRVPSWKTSQKHRYRLEGVPVAYDNIKIVGELADIHDDEGYVHLNIEVDFVIFQPKCGEKLVGVVNNVAPSHIGCLIHGCFNASIPKPFKMPIEAWQHVGVKIGDQMEFEVFRLDSDAVGVFCIRGKMDKKMETDTIERLNEATKEQIGEVSSDSERVAEGGANTEPNVIPEGTPKKKAKKRAFQETLLHNVPGNPEGSAETNTTLEEIPKKKSKKRKYQELNSQTDTAEVDAPMENISAEQSLFQLVNNISNKGRKKKKHHDSLPSVDIDNNNIKVEESSILSHDIETLVPSSEEQLRKSKKKKRKDNSDQGLTQSLQNGITEGPTFTESSLSEDLGAEAGTFLEKMKKKHKKKHKLSSVIEDSTLESTNGGTDFASQESPLDNLTIQQEAPKLKKHKRKHCDNVLAASDDGAYLAVDRSFLLADSQEFAEPKAKKKRKE
ncbi:DNA-directed RNA polymerase I subunit RPA43 isoform X2 [Aquarana catesbeiana]|uniref:DNA-directed RNA polymerase I subunit RPA43 isoform X2 n=1 Tax=Aquarana catesbeiana TaxID=8400 RepID=UPI003CCA1EEA